MCQILKDGRSLTESSLKNSLFFTICGPVFMALPSFQLCQSTLLPLLLLVTSPSIHYLVSCFIALCSHPCCQGLLCFLEMFESIDLGFFSPLKLSLNIKDVYTSTKWIFRSFFLLSLVTTTFI